MIPVAMLRELSDRGLVAGTTVISPYGSRFTISKKGKMLEFDGDGSIIYYEGSYTAGPLKGGYLFCARAGWATIARKPGRKSTTTK